MSTTDNLPSPKSDDIARWPIDERGRDWLADQEEGLAHLRQAPAPDKPPMRIRFRYAMYFLLLWGGMYSSAFLLGRYWPW